MVLRRYQIKTLKLKFELFEFRICYDVYFLQPFFVERVFQIFDKDDNGSISFQEFIDAIHQFAGQTPEDKIKFLFKVYDIDGEMKSDSILLHIRQGGKGGLE